jgi:hypothetical protein
MKKEEFIRKKGTAAWEAQLAKSRRTQLRNRVNKAREAQEEFQKLHYSEQQEILRDMWKKREGHYSRSGLPQNITAARNKIRQAHCAKWPSDVLDHHHEWIEDTAEYTGVALVEREAHRHGIINVVTLLEGVITNFSRS